MNPNDLPLKEKLAALIEAGRVTHPNVLHVRERWGNGKQTGCAMTFAVLGLGIEMPKDTHFQEVVENVAKAMGVDAEELSQLAGRVVRANDSTQMSLDSIVEGLRSETLPEVPKRRHMFLNPAFMEQLFSNKKVFFGGLGNYIYFDEAASFKTAAFGDFSTAWKQSVTEKLPKALPQPAKKVRVSAKHGATWPVAKHAYA